MKKKQHIQKLSYVVKASGLGVFLVVGLSGCDGADDCNKTWNNSKSYTNQSKECQESRNGSHGSTFIPVGTSSNSTKSGYFGSSSSSNYSSGG